MTTVLVTGGAGFLGAQALVSLCHATENLFDKLRNGEMDVTKEIMDDPNAMKFFNHLMQSIVKNREEIDRYIAYPGQALSYMTGRLEIQRLRAKAEVELGDRFETADEAQRKLFTYLEVFYNQRRRHSTIGYVSPAVYEQRVGTVPMSEP